MPRLIYTYLAQKSIIKYMLVYLSICYDY